MRRSGEDLGNMALADLSDALKEVGLRVASTASPDRGDLVVDLDGRQIQVAVTAAAVVSPDRARALSSAVAADGGVRVVVADSVASAAKDVLRDRGWGWLDRRRGHLVMRGGGLFVDLFVPAPDRPRADHRDPITGRGGLAVAAALLLSPDDPPSVRAVAAQAGMASSTVGEAVVRLRNASLVRKDGAPLVPELFWELAAAWPESERVALRRLPSDDVLVGGTDDEVVTGVARVVGPVLTGTAAALAYDAPLLVAGEVPPDFLVPDAGAVARLRRSCGVAQSFESRAASLAVAPTRLACSNRVFLEARTPHPVAHPLFVALDLAQDLGRGREILEAFNPPEPFSRVW